MSLAIDVDKVDQVLLADDWHDVADKSFALDSYEYVHQGQLLLGGGQVEGVPSLGASWKEPSGGIVACPVTAILAVKMRRAAGERGVAAGRQTPTTGKLLKSRAR